MSKSITLTLTPEQAEALGTILESIQSPLKQAARKRKKIDLIERHRHIIPDFETIAKIGKLEGIYSMKSGHSDIARSLENLAFAERITFAPKTETPNS